MLSRLRRFRVATFTVLFTVALTLVTQLWPQPAFADVSDLVSELLTELEARTGYTLTREVLISNTTADRERFLGSDADTVYARTVQVVRDSAGDFRDPLAGGSVGLTTRWDACLIIYTDRLLRLADPRDQRMALAHELAHCYQYDRMGDLRALPDWLREGSAEWMGQSLTNSPNFGRIRWARYLTESLPLDGRSYDAMGFFAQIAYQSVDVWNLLDRFFSADDLPFLSPELFEKLLALSGSRDRILQTWPMGLERNPSAGHDWDTNGPVITADRRAPGTLAVPGTAPIAPTTQYLWNLEIPNGRIVTLTVNQGHGAIRWDRSTTTFNGSFNRRYCVGESCRCEDGSTPAGVESVSTGQAVLAVTTDFTAGTVTLASEAPPCERREEPAGRPSSPGGGSATGSSYGDPHIITYDGYRYSFQTVGEFLLSKSQDGHFEVQARQGQVPGRELSLNTAVAMKMGNQRVALYTQQATQQAANSPTGLWIDGVPTPLQNSTLTLANGGTVSHTDNGTYTLLWPTGEQVAIRTITAGGEEFLNISPTVTTGHTWMGLLGNFNGSSQDDLRDRNGKQVPTQDTYAPVTQLVNRVINLPIPLDNLQTAFFEQLYRQFGDSWRISQAESLFDYGPGQSTATFTNRAFPRQFPSLLGAAPDQIQTATQLCQDANLPAAFLEGCVFDVAATGQTDFAQAAINAVAMTVLDRVQDRVTDEVRNEIENVIPIPLPRWPF